MEFVPLKRINSSSGSVAVQVRVCRSWEARNTKTGTLISLNMIVADEEGTPMLAQIKSTMVRRFRPLLSVGSVYSIKNFSAIAMTGQYRPVDSEYRLSFTLITNVKKIPVPPPSIPMHAFQFVPHATVAARSGDATFLTDVAGCLVAVGDIEVVSGGSLKRDLELKCSWQCKVKVTLWGDAAENFVSSHNIAGYTPPVIVIFTSTTVRQYVDSLCFSGTTSTQIFFNLDHEIVSALHEELAPTAQPIIYLGRSPGTYGTTAEVISENRRSISEILKAEWAGEQPGYKMTFLGCISDVTTKYGWYYFGCIDCKRKVALEGGVYQCPECPTTMTTPAVLFRIQFTVTDKTDTISCTAMNNVAERMVDSSAMKLFNRAGVGKDSFPRQIRELRGREYIFKVVLNEFNLEQGSDVFTVVDVFTPETKARP